MRTDLASWSGDLTRPVPLGAAAVLALNDHVLKGAGVLPAEVTGKLSDVAGLLAGGIAAVCVARGVAATSGRPARRDGRLAAVTLVLVGAAFAALKLWPAFNGAVARVWGVNVLDPSDLWALPMLAVAWMWLRDREHGAGARAVPRRFASAVAMIAVLLVCAATPAPPPVPPQPVAGWVVEAGKLELPCGVAEAWVSKSGRAGAGLTVRVVRASESEPCDVAIRAAALRFADGAIPGREVPVTVPPPSPERRVQDPSELDFERSTWRYVAFEFDNLGRWNRGDRQAAFELELDVAGAPLPWRMPARHVMVSFPVGPYARRYY